MRVPLLLPAESAAIVAPPVSSNFQWLIRPSGGGGLVAEVVVEHVGEPGWIQAGEERVGGRDQGRVDEIHVDSEVADEGVPRTRGEDDRVGASNAVEAEAHPDQVDRWIGNVAIAFRVYVREGQRSRISIGGEEQEHEGAR